MAKDETTGTDAASASGRVHGRLGVLKRKYGIKPSDVALVRSGGVGPWLAIGTIADLAKIAASDLTQKKKADKVKKERS